MNLSTGRLGRVVRAGVAAIAIGAGAFVALSSFSAGHGHPGASRAVPGVAVPAGAPASVHLAGTGPDPYLICIAYGTTYGICLIPGPSS